MKTRKSAKTATKVKAGKVQKGKVDAYQIITDKFIAMLEQGVAPWSKPWDTISHGRMANLKTKHEYKGSNIFLLGYDAMVKGYNSRWWMSYKQALELGGKVRPGEKGSIIVFWKMLQGTDDDGNSKVIPYLRYSTVFNLEQVDGIDPKKIPAEKKAKKMTEKKRIETCEAIVKGYKGAPETIFGGNKASYSATDKIFMPNMKQFKSSEDYYSTYFHEMTHSTGHAGRLNRFTNGADDWQFGSESYSEEELCAELGASFLCGEAGILEKTMDNSAGYLQGWIKKLREDKKFIVYASTRAQKAVAHILGTSEQKEDK